MKAMVKPAVFVGSVVFGALFVTSGLWAQAVAVAQASGQMTDPSGSAVPNATVKMLELERGVSHDTTTDASGRYSLPNLPVGSYSFEASSPGFKTFKRSGIVLQVNDNVQLNVSFEVGDVTERVEVVAGAAMVQTQSNAISQVVDQKRIVDLPLNGRQPTQLVLISGAATVSPPGDFSGSKNYPSSITISVAGGQADGTNYVLDGGDNVDRFTNINLPFPFPDALQEFSLETSALPARNGTQPGGLVNIVTKSGSNQLHGDMFEFLRNGDVNARNFFAPVHDSLKRNQFGGTLGGKLIRDKLFFFGGYQGTRNRSNPPQSKATIPTAAVLSGDISAFESAGCQSTGKARSVHYPDGTPIAGGKVDVTKFDPAAVKLVSYLPQSSSPCGTVTYGIPVTGDEDQGVMRIDYVKSQKQSVFGRYFVTDYRNPAVWNPQNILVTGQAGNLERAQSVTLGDTYTFGPTTVNSVHATFTRRRDNRGTNPQDINANTIGINVFTNVPNDLRVSVGSGAGGFTAGCGTCSPGHFNENTYQFADDLDIVRGVHQFSFGAEFIRTQGNVLSGYLQNGWFNFNGSITGDPILDFLFGSMATFEQSRPQQSADRESIFGLYGQDTIHVNPHLVVNAGLRWEPMFFPYDYFHRGSTFSLANFLAGVHSQVYSTAPAGSLYYGDPHVSGSFTNNRLGNLSPRLGVVWDPQGDGKQTLRAGGALMYDSAEMSYLPERLTSNPPVVNEIDLGASHPGGFSNPWTTGYQYPGGNPFPGIIPPPKNAYFPVGATFVVVPQNLHTTYISQWNVSYQRQISNDWLASISYLGNKTSHIYTGQELNTGIYTPGETSVSYNNRLLYKLNPSQGQYYGNIVSFNDGGNANYNALLASLNHRFAQGFTLLANYTWSHCISEQDFSGDITVPNFLNPNNLAMDRADCNYDIRHIFNASIVATSSWKGNSWRDRLLRNWQVAPLLRIQSGAPINILSGRDNSLAGTNNVTNQDRPNVVSSSIYTSSLGPSLQYLTPSSFAQNAPGTFGNAGRDIARTPGLLDLDASLDRVFDVKERFHLDARVDAFNVINHTNFGAATQTGIQIPGISGGVTNALNSSTFGRITSAGDPRILQFALKLLF